MTGDKRSTLVVVLGFGLALVGCSSSSGSDGDTNAPPSHATLAGVPVKAGDLPSSWQASPSSPDRSGDAAASAQMRSCVGGRSTRADLVDTVYSDDFTEGHATISSNAKSYKSQDDIARDTALLKSPKVDTCYEQVLKQLLQKTLPATANIGNVSVQITPGSGGGPSNLVATGAASVDLSAQGQQATVYVDIAFISGPLVEAQVSFESIGKHVDEALQRQVISAVAERAAEA